MVNLLHPVQNKKLKNKGLGRKGTVGKTNDLWEKMNGPIGESLVFFWGGGGRFGDFSFPGIVVAPEQGIYDSWVPLRASTFKQIRDFRNSDAFCSK